VKRLPNSRLNLAAGTKASLMSNAKGRQPKSRGRNARLGSRSPAIGIAPVANQPGARVSFIPEEVEGGSLEFIEESIVGG